MLLMILMFWTDLVIHLCRYSILISYIQVHIPKRRLSKSFITKMKCQLKSKTTHDVLISKEISYKSYKEICIGEKKTVKLGYNNDPLFMTVENNSLISTPPPNLIQGKGPMSQTWEVLSIFFSRHNIEPNWLNCHFSWGWFNPDLEEWTGCMGKV